MTTPKFRMLRESFFPVMAIITVLFLVLFYVQLKAAFEATRITTVEIPDPALAWSGTETEIEERQGAPVLSAAVSQDPRSLAAARLLGEMG
jgi:hypothetical protein